MSECKLDEQALSEQALLKQAYALAQELAAILKSLGLKLTLAESCTGGMAAETITSLPGSSAWFDCGFVTYSNQSKIDLLNVSNQTLIMHGAVSEPVAAEMAAGCLNRIPDNQKHTYIAGSITGIAGPDGGTADKPVGTVCFAWAGLNMPITTQTKFFSGNRQHIRQQATIFMLQNLIQHCL